MKKLRLTKKIKFMPILLIAIVMMIFAMCMTQRVNATVGDCPYCSSRDTQYARRGEDVDKHIIVCNHCGKESEQGHTTEARKHGGKCLVCQYTYHQNSGEKAPGWYMTTQGHASNLRCTYYGCGEYFCSSITLHTYNNTIESRDGTHATIYECTVCKYSYEETGSCDGNGTDGTCSYCGGRTYTRKRRMGRLYKLD